MIRALLLSLLVLISPLCVIAADRAEIEQKVAELNGNSMRLFGVSLNALRYLIDASPEHYFPMWNLERTGDIIYIRELETKGYISTQERSGLPDGSEPKLKFLRVIPVGAGLEVQQCVVALGRGK
jgi:hypothetical protein